MTHLHLKITISRFISLSENRTKYLFFSTKVTDQKWPTKNKRLETESGFYFRWLENSVIQIRNAASIPLIFHHLKCNLVRSLHFLPYLDRRSLSEHYRRPLFSEHFLANIIGFHRRFDNNFWEAVIISGNKAAQSTAQYFKSMVSSEKIALEAKSAYAWMDFLLGSVPLVTWFKNMPFDQSHDESNVKTMLIKCNDFIDFRICSTYT